MNTTLASTLLLCACLIACKETEMPVSGTAHAPTPDEILAASPSANTVAWYKANKPQRQARIAACRNNPGETMLSPECINATQAQNEIDNARKGLAPLKAIPAP